MRQGTYLAWDGYERPEILIGLRLCPLDQHFTALRLLTLWVDSFMLGVAESHDIRLGGCGEGSPWGGGTRVCRALIRPTQLCVCVPASSPADLCPVHIPLSPALSLPHLCSHRLAQKMPAPSSVEPAPYRPRRIFWRLLSSLADACCSRRLGLHPESYCYHLLSISWVLGIVSHSDFILRREPFSRRGKRLALGMFAPSPTCPQPSPAPSTPPGSQQLCRESLWNQ